MSLFSLIITYKDTTSGNELSDQSHPSFFPTIFSMDFHVCIYVDIFQF